MIESHFYSQVSFSFESLVNFLLDLIFSFCNIYHKNNNIKFKLFKNRFRIRNKSLEKQKKDNFINLNN